MTEPRRPGPRPVQSARSPAAGDGPPPWDHDGSSGHGDRWDRWEPERDLDREDTRGRVNLGDVEQFAGRMLAALLWVCGALFGAYSLATASVWPALGCLLLMVAGGAPWYVLHRAEHVLRVQRQAAELDRAQQEPRRAARPVGTVPAGPAAGDYPPA